MTLIEVSEFSFDYATLDAGKLKFMQTAFKGASAIITGDNGRKEIAVEELKEFDQLEEIVAIPGTLKIAQIVEGLGGMLEKRGLLEFLVKIPPNVEIPPDEAPPEAPAVSVGSAEAKKAFEVKTTEVKKFMAGIEKASASRDQASNVVEDMLDVGRGGNFTSKGAEAMVDEIMKAGSMPAMKAIAGLRGSDQTYAHCVDMSAILQGCYADILARLGKEASDSINRFTLLSGFMHDIGKSEVPKDVLESTERFAPDSQEMLLLRNHTVYGAKILGEMGLHENIINVAHYHHVKKDNSLFTSYPEVSYDLVKPITRLASVVDVYQALIGKRKYKKNWVPAKAIEYILNLKGSEFDERMIEQFIASMGLYPVGTLLKLSTGDIAFVMMIAPDEFRDRPLVAVVQNAQGELLSGHTLLDLMVEKEISVSEIINHYEHFSQSEDQAYQIFQSIRIS